MSTNDLNALMISGPQSGRRRRFTNAEKRRFLEETSRPGETVSSVGRRHGLSVSLLFRWRRQLQGATARRTSNRQGDPLQEDLLRMRDKLSELQRLLGEKTAENEELRRRNRLFEERRMVRQTPTPAPTIHDGRA